MDTITEQQEDYAAVSVRLRWAHDSWARCMRERRHADALTWATETCALAAKLIAVTERARAISDGPDTTTMEKQTMNKYVELYDRFAALAMHAELNTSGWNAESAKALVEAATVAGRTIEAQIAFNAYTLAAAMLEMRRSAYSVTNTRKRAGWDAPTPGMVGAPRRDIGALVDRFLCWPLPDSVRSDDCATKQGYPGRTGTTLLTADEARQMLEYVLMPIPVASEDLGMRAGFSKE